MDGLVVGYRGGPPVLHGISFAVDRGEMVAILGRNGAGKTTLLRAISGLLPARAGAVRLDGIDLRGRPAHEVARLGIGHVPEGRRVIPSMSVIDNLKLGGYMARGRLELNRRLAEAFEIFPMLETWRHRVAGTLSGGEQQVLSIARALMGAPTAMLLDEPLTGLAPRARAQVMDVLQDIRASGKAVALVEQNVAETLPVADRVLIIDGGRSALEGSAEAMREDATIQEKYLGLSIADRSPTFY